MMNPNNHYDSYRYETTARITGGTRWASDDELREYLSEVNLLEKHYPACGLPLICDGRMAYVNNDDSHGLIIGSTGSKKSRLFVMPMLEMIARAGESAIVTDPKGELHRRTSGLFSREGYDIKVLNFRDPNRSNGWNPLYTAYLLNKAGRRDKALDVVADLSEFLYHDNPGSKQDPFWNQKSRAIFQGLCQLLLEDDSFLESQISLSTITELTGNLCEEICPCDTSVMDLVKEMSVSSLARRTLRQAVVGSEKTLENIITSALAPLQIFFTNQALLEMLSIPEIDFREIGMKKSVLYIIMPDEKTTLHALVGMAIKNCYEMLIDTAQHQKNKYLPIRVNYLLDEFSNIPTIPDMSSMITAARSRNIRFYLVVQSMQQLFSKYGEEAYTLRGNCNDWVFLTSRELDLLKELEELCGHDARSGQPLITVSQLQRLNKASGEALVLCGRMYPYLAHLPDVEQYPFANVKPSPLPKLPKAKNQPFDYSRYVEMRRSKTFLSHIPQDDPERDDDAQTEMDDFYDMLDREFEAILGEEHNARQTESLMNCAEEESGGKECTARDFEKFGNYPQTKDGKDNTPIEWIVLEKDAESALLISRYALDCQPFNTEFCAATWEKSTLRKWLNNEFYDRAFSVAEKKQILESYVRADKNPRYNTNPGNATKDSIFLLSIAEANKYFASDEERLCAGTDYTIQQGAFTNDHYMVDGRAACWWWLRSPGGSSYHAADVFSGGSLEDYGSEVDDRTGTVRPCVRVRLFQNESGTPIIP